MLSRLAILSTAALTLAGSAPAVAQLSPVSPVQQQPANPVTSAPRGTAPDRADSSGNLSDKLNKSEGVITPPANVDPGMSAKAPDPSAGTMPIIRPPGEPGGNQSVQPK